MTQTFSASDGQRLAFDTRGAGAPLLCIPGGPGRAAAYLDDLGGLDAHRELVLLDTRGSGGSRPAEPDTLTLERLAVDIEDLRVHRGEAAPVLLAHSFGCRLLAAFAEAHPGVARAMVLVTPPPVGASAAVDAGRAEILEIRADDPVYTEAAEAARELPNARPRDRVMLEQMSVPLWYGRWDDTARAHAARAADETPARTALTLRQAAQTASPPDFAAVDMPVLFLAGQLDFLSPPGAIHAVHETLVAQGFSASTYAEIEGAGHYPWLDEPELFTSVVTDFLDQLDDRGVSS